jgi:hypothetical protein
MRSASFEVALFIIRTYAAVFFNATALCRGHSRWLCVARQKQREIPRHKAVASAESKSAPRVETNVTDHGTRPWHSAIQLRNFKKRQRGLRVTMLPNRTR